jgi:hypothetical protein
MYRRGSAERCSRLIGSFLSAKRIIRFFFMANHETFKHKVVYYFEASMDFSEDTIEVKNVVD